MGADRTPNFNYAKANSLTRIKYIGGGYREFEYEPHKTSDGKTVGGLRLKSIKECDKQGNIASKVRYEYNDKETGLSSGRCFSYPEPTAVLCSRVLSETVYRVSERYPFQLEDYNGAAIVYPKSREIYPNGGYKYVDFYSYDDFQDQKSEITIVDNYDDKDHAQRDYREVPVISYWWARGKIKSLELYNANNELERREQYVYELGPEIKRLIDIVPFMTQTYQKTNRQYRLSTSYWISQAMNLKSHIVEKGKNNLAGETQYTYHPQYNVPIYTVYNDGENTVEIFTKYPFDFNVSNTAQGPTEVLALKKLKEKGMNVPIETYVKKNGKVISAELSTFKEVSGEKNTKSIKPWNTYRLIIDNPIDDYVPATITNGVLTYDHRYIMAQSAEHYDIKGNLTNIYTLLSAKNTSFIYDKFGNKIAEINNAVYTEATAGNQNQIYHTSFENDSITPGILKVPKAKTGAAVMTKKISIPLQNFKAGTYKLSYWKSVNNGESWIKVDQDIQVGANITNFTIGESDNLGYWIDEVRVYPANSRIITTTYKLGFGKTSQMDHNGRVQYWEYDERGRVARVLNNDRETVKEFEYNIVKLNN